MVDVKHSKRHKKCSCGKRIPCFGMPGGKATHCKGCKQQGMVDVINRKCSCGKCRPCFGMPGGKATHCKECKVQGMVNIVSRRCSCGKCIPSFGMLGGSATHCKECKDEGMVDIRSTSRIINAHGVFWLGLMENFAEHQEPFGPKTQKCKVRHS